MTEQKLNLGIIAMTANTMDASENRSLIISGYLYRKIERTFVRIPYV